MTLASICLECGTTAWPPRCDSCGAEVRVKSRSDFPLVSWDEVRDHFLQKLFIDAGWSVLDETSFTWWPWFLEQRISLESTGTFDGDGGDNWVRIKVETPIAEAPREVALDLIARTNLEFPFGVFTYDDGRINIGSTLMLNPECRGLLTLLHHQALIQAAVAHEVALRADQLEGVEPCVSAHPSSGLRQSPDELLSIYQGDRFSLDLRPGYDRILSDALVVLHTVLIRQGWNYSSPAVDVDVYSLGDLDVVAATLPGSPLETKFGPGLLILVRVAPPGLTFTLEEANFANQDMRLLERSSQLSAVVTGPDAQSFGSHLRAYLPYAFLAEVGSTSEVLAINLANAIAHMGATARTFRRDVLHVSDHPPAPPKSNPRPGGQ